ncbi:MAG TPA: hydrogenase maturation nickel metallochaperone HypA [Polyangiaceae bacterium]|nr:hydrogenase maturation nickel metallochaperone HypA [Polyangiaceae bacterium]
MHEMALTQDLVGLIAENCAGRRVTRVVLEIGKLAAVVPDAFRFCFELCAEGTPAEGAALEIVELQGRARCRSCERELALDSVFDRCSCGSLSLEFLSGEQLRLREVEVQ